MSEKPDYVPAHKLPVWLSSEDVLRAIRELAYNGADKAVCWDMTQAIYRLVESDKGIPIYASRDATDDVLGKPDGS